MTTAAQQATIAQVRQNMVSNCQWGVAHRDQIGYAEIRPYPLLPPRILPFTTDCSGFASLMAMWSGAADPNRAGFSGYGNTDTMLAHSSHIARGQTQQGDLVVFGLPPSVHVVVLTQSAAGGDGALCVSHGQPGDPIEVPLTVEIAAHPGKPLTFLELALASGPPPTAGNLDPFCPLLIDGDFGPQTAKALQWKLGVTPQNGVFGPAAKEALQRRLGVPANGVVGPATVKALQQRVGAAQDGDWGAQTTMGLQNALNTNRF